MNYESQNGYFPPSANFVEGTDLTTSRSHWRNWVISILPFLEQQPLYDSFNLSAAIGDSVNRTPRGTDLPVMKCPSDIGHNIKHANSLGDADNWARGNYAANASMAAYYSNPASGPNSGAGTTGVLSYSRWHRGIMGANLSMGVSEIYDGTSNPILLGEVRVGLVAEDRRGTWALDGPGASALWAHGISDDVGPNPCNDNSDDMVDCNLLTTNAGGANVTRAACMTCAGTAGNRQAAPRSQHRGGIHVTMADGSVRFISNYIEKGTGPNSNTSTPSLTTGFLCWQRLCASQDGQMVDGAKF